ncbi:MAG: hypothetical protein M1396_01590 [Chloroflexi bacterium]|nr:hypothetical protein [Chloroflexota bacterium]
MTTAFSMTATLTLQHRPKLYFDSNRNNTNYEIYVANADGSDPHALTHDTHYDSWWPQPSPNGAWIVFYRTPRGTHDRDYGKTSLWRMRTDGTDLTEIIPNHGYGWEIQGHAEWSPDSRYLVMFGGSRINPQIWITNADGTNPVQITNRGGTNIDPTWSPNGQQIAFVGCPQSFCLPSSYSIYTMNSEGSDLRRLTNNSMENHDPSYSPDGKYIAWLVHTSTSGNAGLGSWNIFVMNANGSDQHNLTNDSAINSRPAWSIDGSDTILFFRVAPGKRHWQLFSIPVSGGPMTQLTNVHADSEYPIE